MFAVTPNESDFLKVQPPAIKLAKSNVAVRLSRFLGSPEPARVERDASCFPGCLKPGLGASQQLPHTWKNKEANVDALTALFGEGKDLSFLQMGARAAATFVVALVFIRISGRRSFGQRSPFDYVVTILLGATMSRAIVGASPALPVFVASLVIVLMHRGLAWACVRSRALDALVGGVERPLYRNGDFDREQMLAALVSQTDVLETMRKELGTEAFDCVEKAILERNGEISIVRKQKPNV